MTYLSPAALLSLANEAIQTRVTSRDPEQGTVVLVDPDASSDATKNKTITQGELQARVTQAAMIMFAESGGDPLAVCYNYDGPDGKPACSKTPLPAGTKGAQRGTDRGLWQFNSVWFPKVSDALAFDPHDATEYAYRESKGFSTWGPWHGSNGLPGGERYGKIKPIFDRTVTDMEGTADLRGWIDDAKDAAGVASDAAEGAWNGLKQLASWADGLRLLLQRLLDPAFWRRFGTGALGVLLVLIALALTIAAAKLS